MNLGKLICSLPQKKNRATGVATPQILTSINRSLRAVVNDKRKKKIQGKLVSVALKNVFQCSLNAFGMSV